ncbi:MAG: hydrogenase formation protein HypD [Nannocystaceae bacterium]
MSAGTEPLKFRDVALGRRLLEGLQQATAEIGRSGTTVMHVCGSHEQAMGRFGLRAGFPAALDVVMGPGCPVCITDGPEVDEAVALAMQGVRVTTYGDMLRVPGTGWSLDDARAHGAKVDVVYGIAQAVEIARASPEPVVFFATGFETTAVATAAMVRRGLPPNLSILSAHKYIPPAMEVVASMPDTKVEGYLAAGHAATITGYRIFEPFAARHRVPVVVTGFEPLDILAGLTRVVTMIRDGEHGVVNAFPRCVTAEGNENALATLWEVFEPAGGQWRGIASVDEGNLVLRSRFHGVDARRRFDIDREQLRTEPVAGRALAERCRCGPIMAGRSLPTDCALYGRECTPSTPVGACMVSTEGMCRIWSEYGGRPELSVGASKAAS